MGLLRSLRAVKTTLPVHTMIFDGTLQKPSLLRLRRLGTRVLPIALDAFRPPPWAMVKRRGTFAKLALLTLTQFEVVVWLDNDCRAVRNIDSLALAPTPAFAFASQDFGLNSGVMVIRPSLNDSAQVLQLLAQPAPPKQWRWTKGFDWPVYHAWREGGGGATDQELWTALFNAKAMADGSAVYELPTGFNFRWFWQMSHAERCKASIVHLWSGQLHEANFTQMLADSCSLRVHDDAFIS